MVGSGDGRGLRNPGGGFGGGAFIGVLKSCERGEEGRGRRERAGRRVARGRESVELANVYEMSCYELVRMMDCARERSD